LKNSFIQLIIFTKYSSNNQKANIFGFLTSEMGKKALRKAVIASISIYINAKRKKIPRKNGET
jgi:hypothetical protein